MPRVELERLVKSQQATLGFSWGTVLRVKKAEGIHDYRVHDGKCTGAWLWTLKSAMEIDALHREQTAQVQQAQREARLRKIQTMSDNELEETLEQPSDGDKEYDQALLDEAQRRDAKRKAEAERALQAEQARQAAKAAADAAAKAAEEAREAALPPLWEDPDRERALIKEALGKAGKGLNEAARKIAKRYPNWREIPAAVECVNRLRDAFKASIAKDEAAYQKKLKQQAEDRRRQEEREDAIERYNAEEKARLKAERKAAKGKLQKAEQSPD